MARASNPAGTTAMWVRDRLDGLRLLEEEEEEEGRADLLLDLALAWLKEAGADARQLGRCG